MLIAAFIAGASVVALLPLYVSSCRAVTASAGRVLLSDRVTALLGADETELAAGDFHRVLQLVRLCPEHGTDREGIRAVAVYYRVLELFARLFGESSPRLCEWIELERRRCTYFAAVVLDRSISSSKRMFTQQASNHL